MNEWLCSLESNLSVLSRLCWDLLDSLFLVFWSRSLPFQEARHHHWVQDKTFTLLAKFGVVMILLHVYPIPSCPTKTAMFYPYYKNSPPPSVKWRNFWILLVCDTRGRVWYQMCSCQPTMGLADFESWKIFFSEAIADSTVDWQLRMRYHPLPCIEISLVCASRKIMRLTLCRLFQVFDDSSAKPSD